MEISLAAEKIGQIGSMPITNSMVLSWFASIFLILIGMIATNKISIIPNKIQNFFEMIIEFLFDTANGILENEKATKIYFPLVATLFIFIVTNNWLGLLPGVGTIGFHELNHAGNTVFVPLLRSGNADLNMTLALAIITMLCVQIFGIGALGVFKYSKKFLNFSSPINFFVGILELMGEFTRVISFSFRLFGNIFAGEVLLAVIAFLIPYLLPLPFFFLELFVGVIQALVFTMLALVFIKGAITEAH